MDKKYCLHCMNLLEGDVCRDCGRKERQPAPHHLHPGTVLNGKYLVGAVIGEGGFGITYIGRDLNLDIKVAIKEYFPSGIVNRNNTSSMEITAHVGNAQSFFEKGKSSFLSEARTLAKFCNEPSIVSVRDFFSENNTAYIVMEYLEGTTLKEYISKNGKLTFSDTVNMLTPIMSALTKIHGQGLIHRDISPANIMILKDGTVKLLDFGAAREVSGADEKSLSILLKPGYAPEEQYRTKGQQGPWTDVYALSATMYKMLTGETPDDAMNRLFTDDLKKISQLNLSVTPNQEAIIFRGMAVHQENRYQSVVELLDACTESLFEKGKNMIEEEKTITSYQDNQEEKTMGTPRDVSSEVAKVKADTPPFGNKPVKQETSIPTAEDKVVKAKTSTPPIVKQTIIKEKRPNYICLVVNILFALLTIIFVGITYVSFTKSQVGEDVKWVPVFFTVIVLLIAVVSGFLYFRRLDRKKKHLFARIYGGIGIAAIVVFVVGLIFVGTTTVTIGDQSFKRDVVNVELLGDIITNKDLEKLKELKKLETLEIYECFLDDEDVETIGELTQLKQLVLKGNTDISNVAPLNNLTNLIYLDISLTNTADISCLDKLTKLETLDISNTGISDVSCLTMFSGLTTLRMDSLSNLDVSTIVIPEGVQHLSCSNNGLNDLDFVEDIVSLTSISASNNNISDLSPLIKHENLEIVALSVNNISVLDPLVAEGISVLDLSTNAIVDISILEKMRSLIQLDLSYNQVEDISALSEKFHLTSLSLNNNNIKDISALKDCFRIYSLNISYNQVTDVSALATVDELGILDARSNEIADISPLGSCEKLISKGFSLDLRDNQISDISVLSNFVNTEQFFLSGNKITDISPLKYCTSLNMLILNDNQITDISPLSALGNLKILEVVNNPITSMDGLGLTPSGTSLMETAVLRMSYNENIDFEKMIQNQPENVSIVIFDVPERQKETLREYGCTYFPTSEDSDLDEIEENPDLSDETGEEAEVE